MIYLKKVCHWKGISFDGKPMQGIMQECRYAQVRALLKKKNILPLAFKLRWHVTFAQQTIQEKEIIFFTRQLGNLLQAGFSVLDTLTILEKQFSQQSLMHQVIIHLQLELQKGIAMSMALKHYDTFFNSLCRRLIYIGEQCGDLAEQLLQFAHHQEKLLTVKQKIYKTLYYPTLLLGMTVLMCAVLLTWVVPQFEQLFQEAGTTLPILTQWFIYLSHQLNKTFFIKVFLFIIVYFNIKFYFKDHFIFLNQLFLQIPFLGKVLKQALLAKICYTLGVTLKNRLPITEALLIAAEIVKEYKNYHLALLKIRYQVIEGIALDQALSNQHVFPSLMIQMIAVGQVSGQLDQSFSKLGQLFYEKTNEEMRWMTHLIEPGLVLIIGLFIGGLLFALYGPIFELGRVIEPGI